MVRPIDYDYHFAAISQDTKLDETDPTLQSYGSFVRPNYDQSARIPDITSLDPFQRILFAVLRDLNKKMNKVIEDVDELKKDMNNRIDVLDQLLQGQDSRLRLIEERLAISQRLNEFPPAEEITKLKVQFWVNVEKNKRIRDERKAKGMRGGGSLPNHQLEIHVWTCRPELHAKFPDGDCGEFYIPVYVPNTTHASVRLGNDLDYLPQQNVKWIGMLAKTKVGKWPKQAAMIERDNRLRLFIRDIPFDLGLPTASPPDADRDAARLRWDWPDTRG